MIFTWQKHLIDYPDMSTGQRWAVLPIHCAIGSGAKQAVGTSKAWEILNFMQTRGKKKKKKKKLSGACSDVCHELYNLKCIKFTL